MSTTTVNPLGMPAESGAIVPAKPDDLDFPVWRGNEWVSAPEVYRQWQEYEAAQYAKQLREIQKQARADAVAKIKVTTSTGKTFDGDEDSQQRMARAVLIGQAAGITQTTWTLSDNTAQTVTLAELIEALMLAGLEQSRLWVIA